MRGFLGGVLHPLTDPLTLFPLIVVALALGLHGAKAGSRLLAGFGVAFVAGGFFPGLISIPPAAFAVAVLFLFGTYVLVSRPLPFAAVAPVFAAYALAAAVGQATEFASDQLGTRAFVGAAISHAVIGAYGLLAVKSATKPWLKIGVRVVGSWALAAGVMLFALTLRR